MFGCFRNAVRFSFTALSLIGLSACIFLFLHSWDLERNKSFFSTRRKNKSDLSEKREKIVCVYMRKGQITPLNRPVLWYNNGHWIFESKSKRGPSLIASKILILIWFYGENRTKEQNQNPCMCVLFLCVHPLWNVMRSWCPSIQKQDVSVDKSAVCVRFGLVWFTIFFMSFNKFYGRKSCTH